MERITSRKKFNQVVLDATRKAQKKYGFDMTKKSYSLSSTHNNEADAFKHAYLSWLLSYKYGGDFVSEQLGNMHENEGNEYVRGEKNMDLWNNAMGREIAYDMKRELGGDYDLLGDDWASDYASRKIYEKMKNGELIIDPYDKRRYENLELELLTENDKVYSSGEFKNFDEKVQALKMSKYMDYIVDNNWEAPTEKNLNKKVQSGELIYVENYERSDGTKVQGYYRRRQYFASKKSSK